MNTFSIGECVRFGWETFKKRPWFFIGVFFLLGLFTMNFRIQVPADHMPSIEFTPTLIVLGLLFVLALMAIQTLARMGTIQFSLRAHDAAESVRLKDAWAPHPFWRFFFVNVVYGLIVAGGLILLIVPGIIWSLKYQFAPYLVMDRGLKIREALKESGRMTNGYKWRLFLFGLALAGVCLLGLLALVVGLLVAVPVVALAYAHAYRSLQKISGAAGSVQ